MALFHSPRIVSDSMTLYYDEDNVKSGSSSENIAQRNGSRSSSLIQFSQDNLLRTMWAQTAQYNSSAPSPGTGFTLNAWIRRTGETTGTWNQILLIDSGGPRYRMLWFGWYSNRTDRIHFSMPYYSAIDTAAYKSVDPTWANAGLTLNINQWYNFCGTYDNTTRKMTTYINGIFALEGTRPGLGDANNPNTATVRIWGTNNTSFLNSQCRAVSFYNRALSADEVKRNYLALKGRFE